MPRAACSRRDALGLAARRSALDGARQQRIERRADEELESLDGRQRCEGRAGPQVGIFDDFVKPPADALHGQAFGALSIHHFLQIARRLVERQRRIDLARQTLREPGIKQLVPWPESDRARPDHSHDLAFANPGKKLIPKSVVQVHRL